MALARLEEQYCQKIVPALKDEFGLKNVMAVPRLQKIVVNMGVGKAIGDMKILDSAVADLEKITGQKPVVTLSRKAISNFKLRENIPIGCKVTLRGKKMYEFMDRLVSIALPRIKDFNGVSRKSFDNQGNYTLGLSEQAIFPEIDFGRMTYTQGMDITFVFNQGTKEQNMKLLTELGMPFRKN